MKSVWVKKSYFNVVMLKKRNSNIIISNQSAQIIINWSLNVCTSRYQKQNDMVNLKYM